MANSFPMPLLTISTLILIFHFNVSLTTATTVVSKDETSCQMCLECENPCPPVQPPPLPPPPVVECPPPPLPPLPPPTLPPPILPECPPPPFPPCQESCGTPPGGGGAIPVPPGPHGLIPAPPNPMVPYLPYYPPPPPWYNSSQLRLQSTAFTFSFLILAFLPVFFM